MDMKTIMAIIEALRTRPSGDRIVYKDGKVFRTEPSPYFGKNVVQRTADDIGYTKYRRMSERMGETPVSYEDWMTSN